MDCVVVFHLGCSREVSDVMFVAHGACGSSPQSDINCTSIRVTKEMPDMGRISQRFMVVPLLNALVLANNLCQESEDAALITVYNNSMNLRQTNLATSWQSPRDLAIVPPPTEVHAGAEVFTIYSAVPSFGEDGNFIALLLRKPIKGRSIFCSGSGRAHISQVRIFEHAMLCDWPEEEKKHEVFEVFLEDANGKHLAKVIANRKFGLLKKYQTVACVREIFAPERPNSLQVDQSAFAPALKMLVQWMEYNWLHGIDHFFIYTFNGTERAIKDVMEPYLKSGVATRIHFDNYPGNKILRQQQVANDCLYRAKNHAKWALPSLDIDEYFRITSKQVFPGGGTVPQNYMRTCWDALVKHYGKKPEEVPAFVFWKFLGFHFFFCGGFFRMSSMSRPHKRIFIGDRVFIIVTETKSSLMQFDAV